MKRWIVSWAQNATPVHPGFLAALQSYPGTLVVLRGRYRNPTSRWSKQDQDDQWYDQALEPYLYEERAALCRNLTLYGDVHVRPTAARPLTGFEVFCGGQSAIFGHPKRALEVIPTASRSPRILVTTGACTRVNYTDSKAGKKGEAHHVLGALVVEVEKDGTYHLRHVSACPDGSFIDLDKLYRPGQKPIKAPPALAMSLGDLHAGREEPSVLKATRALAQLIKPEQVFLHDVLDFKSRNHHDRGLRAAFVKRRSSVSEEVEHAVGAVRTIASWGRARVNVVRSNHDEAFDRWLEEAKPHEDPENAHYWFQVWDRLFRAYTTKRGWIPAFEIEAKRLGVPANVHFLRRNEDVRIKGVSYGFHGDRGLNGSRGTPNQYAKLGVKTVTGHTHTPSIRDGNFTAGVTAGLDHGYNGLPSTWLNAHVAQYANGKRALIAIVNGRFRGSRRPARPARPSKTPPRAGGEQYDQI